MTRLPNGLDIPQVLVAYPGLIQRMQTEAKDKV